VTPEKVSAGMPDRGPGPAGLPIPFLLCPVIKRKGEKRRKKGPFHYQHAVVEVAFLCSFICRRPGGRRRGEKEERKVDRTSRVWRN